MKRKSNKNKKRTLLTHKLFYRDYFLFLCLDRNHFTNLLSDPRGNSYENIGSIRVILTKKIFIVKSDNKL